MATTMFPDFKPTTASIPPKTLQPSDLQFRLTDHPALPLHKSPLNPIFFILRAALIYPHKAALIHPEGRCYYTFSTWAQRIQNLAYALIEAGVRPGGRVAVLAPNCPLIADAHHGVLAARAIVCPINTRLTKPEVEYIVGHSGAKIVLCDSQYSHLLKGVQARIILSHDSGREGDPYEAFLASGRKFSGEKGWLGLQIDSDEDVGVSLCYTSGTTGKPKGVLTTGRGSYLAAMANAVETAMNLDSTYLWVLPMFHAAGWTFPWTCVFAFATQITIRTVSFPQIWQHFVNSGVTHYCGAPTVQVGIANASEAIKLRHAVMAIIAGSAPTAHLIGELEKLNIQVTHTYGPFTRGYRQASWSKMSLEDRARHVARQGHAFCTAYNARVVVPDESGNQLTDVRADGKTVGEIVTRGNIVMKEYFQDPEATRKTFRGGYFLTGDLAVQNPDGSISIQDRSKDLIISGGENASSLAIEQELVTHPDVLEIAVVARKHEKWGERPMAFVTLREKSLDKWKDKDAEFEADFKAYAKSRLPGFSRPEWVRVVKELPKTSTGKITKTTLRKAVAKL